MTDNHDPDVGLGAPSVTSSTRATASRPSATAPPRVAPPTIGRTIPSGGAPPISAPPSSGPPSGGGTWGSNPPSGTPPSGGNPPNGGPPDFSNEPLLPPGGTPIPPGQTGVSCCRCVYITKASDKYGDIPLITGVDLKTLNFMNGGYAHTYSQNALIGAGLEIVLPPAACVTGLTKGIEEIGMGNVKSGSNCVPTGASFTQRALVRYADGSPRLLAPGEALPSGTWAPAQAEDGSWGIRILFGGTFTRAAAGGVRVFELPRNAVLLPSDGISIRCQGIGLSGIEAQDDPPATGVGEAPSEEATVGVGDAANVVVEETLAAPTSAIVLSSVEAEPGVGEIPVEEPAPRTTTALSKMDVRWAMRKKNAKLFRQ